MKIVIPFIILIFLSTATHYFQTLQHSRFPHTKSAEKFNYLPNGTFLKGAALSFDEILADLLWIKALSYFGGDLEFDQDYGWLNHLLLITTTLDPFFLDPYEFGGVVLSGELADVDEGIKILQKGMKNVPPHHPRYWYLPFFTAFNFMYHKADYQTAAKYLEQAATFPESPSYLPLLVARLYANTEDPGLALPFLEEMLNKTASPEMKESLEKRIKDIQVKQHVQLLSKACMRFHERRGRYPEDIAALVGDELLNVLPVEPYGGQYRIAEYCTVHSTSNPDSMKLHIKKKNNP